MDWIVMQSFFKQELENEERLHSKANFSMQTSIPGHYSFIKQLLNSGTCRKKYWCYTLFPYKSLFYSCYLEWSPAFLNSYFI